MVEGHYYSKAKFDIGPPSKDVSPIILDVDPTFMNQALADTVIIYTSLVQLKNKV